MKTKAFSATIRAQIVLVVLSSVVGWSAEQRVNLLANGDFEDAQNIAWEKRTPDSKERALSIIPEAAHSGKLGARIVNKETVISRWRQGGEGSLKVPAGSSIRLSGWIRTNLGTEGLAALRLYCIGAQGKILAQPQTPPVRGKSDWKRVSMNATVPEGCEHLMVYLELNKAVGTADYDDIALNVVSSWKARRALNDLFLLTDAPTNDATVVSLRTLYPDRLTLDASLLTRCRGVVVFARKPETHFDFAAIDEFARRGNPVVLDLAVYAAMRGLTVREVVSTNLPMLRIVREHPATTGFKAGDVIPWYSGTAKRWRQRVLDGVSSDKVLAESSEGGALLVAEKSLLATDLTGLGEPVYNQPGSFNKYLFAGNVLGRTVRYGRHFPQRLKYAEFVEAMRKLVAEVPGLRLEDEGPASGDYRIYSLNFGDPKKPTFFIYGVTHGSEWEPGYGLLTLARHLAAVDAKRYSVKIIPILNPSGYDLNRRQNAAGVDLNRNGGDWWDTYKGRDSNNDGMWGPGDYDWKGTGPFSEPESQTFRAICERTPLHASLDFHGNAGGRGNNRLVILPLTAREDNEDRAETAVRLFNDAMRNRYVLQQANCPGVAQYDIEAIRWNSQRPTLNTTAAKGRYGFLVEVPAGYGGTYGMVMQTDIVVETSLAFIRAYQTP